jgi:ABC-2 type transport system permease protein
VVGLTTGTGAAVSVGDSSYVGEMTVAHLAHAPGVLVLLGMAALLFGVLPTGDRCDVGRARLRPVRRGLFGTSWIFPSGSATWCPWSTRVNLPWTASPGDDDDPPRGRRRLAAAGLAGFRRRDLETK